MQRPAGGPGAVASPFASRARPARRRLPADLLAVVFAGGCIGGFTRYAVVSAWDAPRLGFPAATLVVNLVGALVLGVVVVVAAELRPTRYLRPLVGTGFCGALTTFSGVAVTAAELIAHGRVATASTYLAVTIGGGLAAAAVGVVGTRALAVRRRPPRNERSA